MHGHSLYLSSVTLILKLYKTITPFTTLYSFSVLILWISKAGVCSRRRTLLLWHCWYFESYKQSSHIQYGFQDLYTLDAFFQTADWTWGFSHRMQMSLWAKATLFIFCIKVAFSKLSHCKQIHQLIVMVVQKGHHITLPQHLVLSLSTKCFLTNDTEITKTAI